MNAAIVWFLLALGSSTEVFATNYNFGSYYEYSEPLQSISDYQQTVRQLRDEMAREKPISEQHEAELELTQSGTEEKDKSLETWVTWTPVRTTVRAELSNQTRPSPQGVGTWKEIRLFGRRVPKARKDARLFLTSCSDTIVQTAKLLTTMFIAAVLATNLF